MKIKRFSIWLFLVISLFLLSCAKTDEELLMDKYNSHYVTNLLDKVLKPYIQIKWDFVSVDVAKDENGSLLGISVYAYGQSKDFGNERFYVDAFWPEELDAPNDLGYIVNVGHEAVGEVAQIVQKGDALTHCMPKEEFLCALRREKLKYKDIFRERKKNVELAYENKTKVHFGITRKEYYDYDIEYRKNFIDGLVGKDAYELVTPSFSDEKFVGFEINSSRYNSVNTANMVANAKLIKSHKLDGSIRFDSIEEFYDSDLCNFKVFTQTELPHGGTTTTITVWWNKCLKGVW